MKIYAPVKDFNGLRNNVRFVNGVGETDNLDLIEWFKNHGYLVKDEINLVKTSTNDQIEKTDDEIAEVGKIVDSGDKPNFDNMTPNELREWLKTNGYGSKIKNIRNKEKLLEILRGG